MQLSALSFFVRLNWSSSQNEFITPAPYIKKDVRTGVFLRSVELLLFIETLNVCSRSFTRPRELLLGNFIDKLSIYRLRKLYYLLPPDSIFAVVPPCICVFWKWRKVFHRLLPHAWF